MKKTILTVLAMVLYSFSFSYAQTYTGPIKVNIINTDSDSNNPPIKLWTFADKLEGTITFSYVDAIGLSINGTFGDPWPPGSSMKFTCSSSSIVVVMSHAKRGPNDNPLNGHDDHSKAATEVFKGVASCSVEVLNSYDQQPRPGLAMLGLNGKMVYGIGEDYPNKITLKCVTIIGHLFTQPIGCFGLCPGTPFKGTFSSVLLPETP